MGFTKLNIHEKVMKGLNEMGFEQPTSIQARTIPEIKNGRDIVGQSLTGSGKTAAFGIPLLEKVVPGGGIQALILTPTRELCLQVRDSIELMGKYVPLNIISIFGGVGYSQQKEQIQNAEIVVATPGRLLDHLNQRTIDLSKVIYVVLDEADIMVDMGFLKDVEKILQSTAQKRQTTMFSATMPPDAKRIIKNYLKDPIYITEELHVGKDLLKQKVYRVTHEKKYPLLIHLLKNNYGSAIIFCRTKRMVDKLAKNIKKQGFAAMPVHGDIVQSKRQLAVRMFKEKKIDFLVATDVAARGLDIPNVSHIYNYDMPKTPEEYTHRIGRTARAGKAGEAINLLGENDHEDFNMLIKSGKEIVNEELPEFEMIPFIKGPRDNKFSYDDRPSYGRGDRTGRNRGRSGFGGRRNSRDNYSRDRPSYSPRKSFSDSNDSSEDRPRKSFSGPRREYERDLRPRNNFGRSSSEDRPRRSFNRTRDSSDDKPRRSFGRDSRPRRSFDGPRGSSDDRPRRSFGRTSNYSSERTESSHRTKNSYSRPRTNSNFSPRKHVYNNESSDDSPSKSFSAGPRKSFSNNGSSKSFSSDRPKKQFKKSRARLGKHKFRTKY